MTSNPITHADILAFTQLAGVRLRPWQVEAIEQLDSIWFEVNRG